MAQENGPALLIGAAAGAALVYLFDSKGRRRRRVAAEKAGSYTRKSARYMSKRARDLRNRAQGVVAETRGRFSSGDADDDTLVARVRSQLGHHVSHVGEVETSAEDGVVTLRGSVLANELGDLLGAIRAVRGVREVRNELTVYEHEAEMRS
ncbi:MAG TPA: BON domain-containing protein [Gemmatimonadaceae bacterium]|nr:BON domain-containing protein [Gemmatimonadaceae bacterium]